MKHSTPIKEELALDLSTLVTVAVPAKFQSEMRLNANSDNADTIFRAAVPEVIFTCETRLTVSGPRATSSYYGYHEVILSLDGLSERAREKMMYHARDIEIDISGKFVYITWRENNNGQ